MIETREDSLRLTVSQTATMLAKAYTALIKSKTPFKTFPSVMLWGPPGVGKSQGVRQTASKITEETAKWSIEHFKLDANIEDIYKPEINILIGCAYLDYLTDIFNDETETVIAAYNAGQGNVKKWLNDNRNSDDDKTLTEIPFGETKHYVTKVMKRYEIYKNLY